MKKQLNIGLPQTVEDSDLADLVVAVDELHYQVEKGLGLLVPTSTDTTSYPVSSTINSQASDKVYCTMTSTLQLGAYVELAQGAAGLECSVGLGAVAGFVSEILAADSSFVAVALFGLNDNLSGLTVGERYYLGANGSVSLAGTVILGVAVSETGLYTRWQ